jgi:hypothetical protein
MDAYSAGQQLGTLLFGKADQPGIGSLVTGQPNYGSTYFKTLTQGAQAQNVMQQARMNRAKALIEEQRAAERAKLPTAVSGVYTNPAQAALAEAVLGGNTTADLRDLGTLQNPNAVAALGEAATDMQAGNFAGYNQQTALATGKPYEPVRVVGNTMLPDGVPLGDAAFNATATPVGQADIEERLAQAGAAHALAGQRNTLTPIIAALDQARAAAAGRSNNPTTKGPNAAELRLAFSHPDTDPKSPSYGLPVVDTQALADFYASGEPFQQYVAEHYGTPKPGQPLNGRDIPIANQAALDGENLGDLAASAALAPSAHRVIINMAPGTDPAVIAAARAAAAADQRASRPAPALPPQPAHAAQQPGGIAMPATQADFDALPKGALFVNPKDGKTYRKK